MAVEIATVEAPPAAKQTSGLSVGIKKRLRSGQSRDFMLDVEFFAPAGITILFGASGTGKTTVLDCLAGLLQPDSGHIVAGSRVLFEHATGLSVPTPRRSVGYVFQDLALFPHLSVEKNIGYGLAAVAADVRRERTSAMCTSLGIGHLRQRLPGEISGGERQRVALARALVTDPCLLLLDEPLGGLDQPIKSAILNDLRSWNRDHRIPILYVTHDRGEVFALGERVLVMERGRIISQGTPHQALEAPRHEIVAQLAGFENIFDARVVALHEHQGTMTCELHGSSVALEAPLARAKAGSTVRLAVRAGDILLAIIPPSGLSARNMIPGKLISLEQHDFMVVARVDCGVSFEVHLTPGARESLGLALGQDVWLVLKTHSCHLVEIADR